MNRLHRYGRAVKRVARQCGFTILELAIASALFAVLLTMCVQMLRAATDQQRATDRRVLALQTVQNVAEQLESFPFAELDSKAVDGVKIPDAVAAHLKDAELSINLFDDREPIAKRATIELTWRDHRGIKAAPLRLTVWRYPDAAVQ